MIGIVSWLVCGVIAGMIVSKLISGFDKGILLLTLGVGVGGAMAGGVIASFCGYGNIATYSNFAVIFATVGAALLLWGYSRFVEY